MRSSLENASLSPAAMIYSVTDPDKCGRPTYATVQYQLAHPSHLTHDLYLQQTRRDEPHLRDATSFTAVSFVPHETFAYQHTGFQPVLQERMVQTPTQPVLSGLPHPQKVLPSQTLCNRSCLACGKPTCDLISHKHFSRYLALAKDRGLSRERIGTRSEPARSPSQMTVQFPILMNDERRHLLSLWSREWSPVRAGPERHLFPSKFVDRILPAAKSHAPLFQAFLALGATTWALANDVTSEVASRNLNYATHLLSKACPTEQSASTDEAMLAAILILLIYLALGNAMEVGKHISGLVHLVKLRGGPHYLGLSGLVAETLIHTDHMQAIFFDREPVWRLPLPPLEIGLPRRLGQGFDVALSIHSIDAALAMAAKSLCRVADIFNIPAQQNKLPLEGQNALGYLSTISEYQLAVCHAAYNATSTRCECVCLALILFNNVVLRNDGTITPPTRKIEYRFWTALENAEAGGQLMDLMPTLYVWMLFTGLTVSIRADCPWRTTALGKIRVGVNAAGITTWEQLTSSVLNNFVWLASAQENAFRQLWSEVDMLKTGGTRPP